MAKRRITFEVDDCALFDAVLKMKDGGEACGTRLVSCLLGGSSWREAAGLSLYGIEIVEETVT